MIGAFEFMEKMKAILVKKQGGIGQLTLGEFPKPVARAGELLVRVKATALNRADILQREGKYPPPPGASPLLGLEAAGIVEEVGEGCSDWKIGDRVMALLPGGGYAEFVTIPCRMAMPIPAALSFEEAAAIPEVFLTAFQVLFWIARLQADEYVLIHAGASGVGTAAIQLVKTHRAFPIVTAGSPQKLEFCRSLGAVEAINYKEGPFSEAVLRASQNYGADVIIDPVGAAYWQQNLQVLAVDGRWVMIATMGGSKVAEFNLRDFFRKRAQLTASSLRARSLEYKIRLTQDFIQKILPKFESGEIKPVVDKIFDWQDVQAAHRYMEENRNMGKIVLRVG